MNLKFLYRKKNINSIDDEDQSEGKLPRVLTIFDLTALGVGTTLGSGIYVLAGSVIKNVAGPSLVVSFFIAAAVSIVAALCYSELGARVPKTGSAYAYVYVCVGEFMAFIIGWNLLLEYVIGSAGVSRAFSNYLDSLIDGKIAEFFRHHMPIDTSDLSKYPDFFSFGFTLVITLIVSIGVKESSFMNKMFTLLNISVILFVIVFGSVKSSIHNWQITPEQINSSTACNGTDACGHGGFFPFGFSGTLAGTAKCFIAFIGFDSISTTGGEVVNPTRSIPISIISSLLICCTVYCGVSTVLSLMVPYYLLNQNAPMPDAFKQVNWPWAQYLVACGALISLSTCLLSAVFALSRVLYAIAADGLVFKFLANVNQRFQTPFIATWTCGILSGIFATIFDLQELVNMTSIGTLLAYSLVAISVLILRYKPVEPELYAFEVDSINSEDGSTNILTQKINYPNESLLKRLFNPSAALPTKQISTLVYILTFITVVLLFLTSFLVVAYGSRVIDTTSGPFIVLIILCIIIFGIMVVLCRQPQNRQVKTFLTPFVPVSPLLSVFVNFYLIMVLPSATWIRFGIWMVVGFIIYFVYGIRNSTENEFNNINKK